MHVHLRYYSKGANGRAMKYHVWNYFTRHTAVKPPIVDSRAHPTWPSAPLRVFATTYMCRSQDRKNIFSQSHRTELFNKDYCRTAGRSPRAPPTPNVHTFSTSERRRALCSSTKGKTIKVILSPNGVLIIEIPLHTVIASTRLTAHNLREPYDY